MAERKSIVSIDLGTNYLFARVLIKKKDPAKTNKVDIVKHAKVGEKVLTMPSGVAYEDKCVMCVCSSCRQGGKQFFVRYKVIYKNTF